MKNILAVLLLTAGLSIPWACTRSYDLTGSGGGGGSAPVTITVSINNGSLGTYAGYYYQASGFTNNSSTGVLSLTAHVGDTVILPNVNGFHPLYFDNGSTTCLYNGSGDPATSFTYVFPSAGTYYFHCGFHAANCSLGLGACGSTNCTALAGVITVS